MFLSKWREFPLASWLAKKNWQLASLCCWNRDCLWHVSKLVSFLVGLRTYQHLGNRKYIVSKQYLKQMNLRNLVTTKEILQILSYILLFFSRCNFLPYSMHLFCMENTTRAANFCSSHILDPAICLSFLPVDFPTISAFLVTIFRCLSNIHNCFYWFIYLYILNL